MDKDEILRALPKLPKADLEAIHALAGHLLGPANGGLGEQGQAVFDALAASLGLTASYASMAASKPARLFIQRLPAFVAFVGKNFPGWDDTKVGQQAFLRMLFGLIITDLNKRNVTASFGMVVSNMGRLPEIIESAFPDYLKSGLGKIILEKFYGRE
jgi:hypothetical protein